MKTRVQTLLDEVACLTNQLSVLANMAQKGHKTLDDAASATMAELGRLGTELKAALDAAKETDG